MVEDPLYVKIINEMKPGQPAISVRDAMTRWDYSESHTRRVMDWMAGEEQPPTMKKLTSVSPHRWERI